MVSGVAETIAGVRDEPLLSSHTIPIERFLRDSGEISSG
jgi:hypothetical protein